MAWELTGPRGCVCVYGGVVTYNCCYRSLKECGVQLLSKQLHLYP